MIGMTNTEGTSFSSTDALLRVQAPAGSVVTMTRGGTTKIDNGHENKNDSEIYDYYFVIHQSQFSSTNEWTVMATLGEEMTSDTIIINASDEYNMSLYYRIPLEYKEIEYIENIGSSYINTLIKPSEVKTGSCTFMPISPTAYAYVFGASSGSSNTEVASAIGCQAGTSNLHGFWYCANQFTASLSTTSVKYIISFDLTSGSMNFTYNGVQLQQSISTGSPTSTYPFYLFGFNYSGTNGSGNVFKGRIYSFILYGNNGNVLCDLRPCYRKSDSVVGMWDIVSKQFLINSGSGTFVAGPNYAGVDRRYFYLNGESYDSLTGGYTLAQAEGTLTTLTVDSLQLMALVSGTNGTERWAATVNTVDLTKFSTLTFYCYNNSSGNHPRIGIASTRGGTPIASATLAQSGGLQYSIVDISNITGSYYIEFSNLASNNGTYINLIFAD